MGGRNKNSHNKNNWRSIKIENTLEVSRGAPGIMKTLGLLLFLGTVVCDPFWKYPKPEKFVEWAEEVIPIVQEQEGLRYSKIELHNLANVVYSDILGAKGMKVGKKWMIQAIYVNPEEKYKFYCLIHKSNTPRRPEMADVKVNCEQYRF